MRFQFCPPAAFRILLVSLALAASLARAQEGPPKNLLSFKIGLTGTAAAENGTGRRTFLEFGDGLHGTIEVRPGRDSSGGITWYPRGDQLKLEGRISQVRRTQTFLNGEGGARAEEITLETFAGAIACDANLVNAMVKLRPADQRYDLQFALMADMASTQEAVRYSRSLAVQGDTSVGGGRRAESSSQVALDMGPAQMGLNSGYYAMTIEAKNLPLVVKGDVLTGVARIPVAKPANWNGAWDIAIEASWRIGTALPPVELVVTIDNYAAWRPKGSISKPTEPGNAVVARATLKSKGAKAAVTPEVKAIRFALLDTSREPGVCLNWPLHAQDDAYDLRLAAASTREGVLSRQEQNMEIKNPPKNEEGERYAEARIESYDFGARASLYVVCELEDGREIVGVMKGEGDLVRLPKMNGPDWIAENWRKEKKVEKLAALDDDEKVDGQKDNGDGFTLYEEYRGWVVNGKHVEGDPEKKDFFVLNLIGADGRAGIDLFEALSKLRVHSKLRRSEMSQTTRLMNGNHREAPHRVNQHGVWMKTFTRAKLGDNGADTPMTKAGVAGRPGITKGIGILARNDAESIFNRPFNLPARDTLFAYDRAVAHELLHSVGVEHHGDGDYRQIWGYVSPRNPLNKLGRPYYGSSPNKPVGLLDEAGQDIAAKDYADYVKFREFLDLSSLARELEEGRKYIERNGVGWNGIQTPQQYADANIELLLVYCFMHLDGTVGVTHGAHSGDQDCVMRYYFAKFYEAGGRQDTLYVATPGTERIGIDLCHAATGTGINAAGHKPQSRYGNAAGGEGNCFAQICPNDAIPPRKVK